MSLALLITPEALNDGSEALYQLTYFVNKDAPAYSELYTEFGSLWFPVHEELLLQVKNYFTSVKIIHQYVIMIDFNIFKNSSPGELMLGHSLWCFPR